MWFFVFISCSLLRRLAESFNEFIATTMAQYVHTLICGALIYAVIEYLGRRHLV